MTVTSAKELSDQDPGRRRAPGRTNTDRDRDMMIMIRVISSSKVGILGVHILNIDIGFAYFAYFAYY